MLWTPIFLTLLVVAAVHGADSDSLLWGTYRPNLYFGLRPRLPQSLMTGLIWFGTQDYQNFMQSRHACEQSDELAGYSWTEYDAREGGVQVLSDPRNNVNITIEYLKVGGGDHGGSWAARVKGAPSNPALPSRTSFLFYMGIEGLGNLDMETDEEENGIEGPIKFAGFTPDLGEFHLRVVDGPNNEFFESGPHLSAFAPRVGKTHYMGSRVPVGEVWKARDVFTQAILKHAQSVLEPYKDPALGAPDPSFTLQLPDEVYSGSNLFGVQKFFEGEFQFDVFYESSSAKQKLSSSVLDSGIPALKEKYSHDFQERLPSPPGTPSTWIDLSKALTSNLVAGVAYFFGDSVVDRNFAYDWDQDEDGIDKATQSTPEFTEPKALLTATPSRSFFPRGFYWDEGFHLLHIGAWDNDLSLEILNDWIKLIDDDGWVAREQILGDEARSKVPAEFVTQNPSYANPPTLAMAVTAFIDRLNTYQSGPSSDDLGLNIGMDFQHAQAPISATDSTTSSYLESSALASQYLKSIYPPLKRHYEWFRRTQRGQIKQYRRKARSRTEAYRWRGRTADHVLTSGLDDYPRGPADPGELHLDLMSWMAFFTRTMKKIAKAVGEEDDEKSFAEIEKAILNNLDDLHWSEDDQMYCDVGLDMNEDSYHVCHKGYISLFPVMLGLLPADSPHVGPILDLISSPEHLWSPYGVRSLSVSHPEFGQGENYWKGPIWIQMNYMILSSLHKIYAKEPGPLRQRAEDIYIKLRQNIIENVYKEYERTGYTWEQYDPITGEGKRSHPFTGWTSLVALIIAEKY